MWLGFTIGLLLGLLLAVTAAVLTLLQGNSGPGGPENPNPTPAPPPPNMPHMPWHPWCPEPSLKEEEKQPAEMLSKWGGIYINSPGQRLAAAKSHEDYKAAIRELSEEEVRRQATISYKSKGRTRGRRF